MCYFPRMSMHLGCKILLQRPGNIHRRCSRCRMPFSLFYELLHLPAQVRHQRLVVLPR